MLCSLRDLRRVIRKDITLGLWPHSHIHESAAGEPTREASFPQSTHPWRWLNTTRSPLPGACWDSKGLQPAIPRGGNLGSTRDFSGLDEGTHLPSQQENHGLLSKMKCGCTMGCAPHRGPKRHAGSWSLEVGYHEVPEARLTAFAPRWSSFLFS